jgi:protease-4
MSDGPQPQKSVPEAAPSEPQTTPTVVIQSSDRRSWLPWLGWMGFLLCGLLLLNSWNASKDYYDVSGGVREKYVSGPRKAKDKVAVIRLEGVIMEGDGFVKRQIDQVSNDPDIKAVVLRVDSPGGTVTGSDYIYHHLVKLSEDRDIPLVVSMGSIAASGGYYVSMAVGDQSKSIYAEPTTTTGSIGVIVPHYDISGLMARYDVKNDSITSHARKQMLSMTRSMSEEDREIIQAYVDESFNRFKEIVRQGRPNLRQQENETGLLCPETGRDLATGEIFTANQAKQYGLVDEIGFIEDAIDRAIEIADLDKERVRVVRYRRPPTLLGIAGLAESPNPGLSLSTLFELSSPRAYFLATSMPPLVSSRRPVLAD